MEASSSSHISFSGSGLSSDDFNDDGPFCDITDFDDNYQQNSNDNLIFNEPGPEVSEESLREDIEKVEKLRVDEVRWFYCTKKKKKWKPLLGFDSIRVEKEWRRYASKKCQEEDVKRICVRGGMYEIDVIERKCYPVYWSFVELTKSDSVDWIPVHRGTWFFEVNWQPLDEDLAVRVEEQHYERWKGYDIQQIKQLMSNKIMHSVHLDGCHVEWNSVTDVLFYKDATTHRAFRNIITKFGVSKATSSGYRLHRGYKEDAMEEDRQPSIKHLVFVIHGIGAKGDRRKIVRNTADFRSLCRRLQLKNIEGRSEFIPVEWRSRLKLDEDIIESITPTKGQGVRRFVNNTAMDIMYYASPLYRNEIVCALRDELNRIHKLFRDRNPNFNGKISVLCHSLGNVIFHDILNNWNGAMYEEDPFSPRPRFYVNDFVRAPRLNFSIDTMFSIGSPLGVFLCLRGYRPENGSGAHNDIIPVSSCRRIFNVFHPADPVAYRLEPLILPHYSKILPEQIKTYASIIREKNEQTSPKTTENDESQTEVDDTSSDLREDQDERTYSSAPEGSPSQSPSLPRQPSYLRSMAGGAVRIGRGVWSRVRGGSMNQVLPQDEDQIEVDTATAPLIERREDEEDAAQLEDRIDYELPEGFTERKLGYASLTSHTSYWNNQDLAMFVMTKLYS
ncbi:phospholipase DDHD1-like [Clavelina lepadiformis]|uniref:phospholipase DDHD1-like n=1 Tax=Clavelina lepadiformis TaxID=159417 RepID=UPI0040433BA6